MKIEGFVGNLDINMSSMPDILSKLAVGDIIRAKVLNISANDLILKLFDGTTLNANSLTSLDIVQGDVVDFVVKSNINNQLVLETVKEKDNNQKSLKDSELSIKKQLIELDIKPDKKNMEIAKEIKQTDLPLNKEVFGKIADAIIGFKNFTPQKAAYLVANNIIPEEKNISILNKIVDEKQKISSMVQSTLDSLYEITDNDVISSIRHALKHSIIQGTDTEHDPEQFVINDSTRKELVRSTIEKAFADPGLDKGPTTNAIKEKLTEFITASLKEDHGAVPKHISSDKFQAEKAIIFLKENLKGVEKTKFNQVEFVESILKNTNKKIGEKLKSFDIPAKDETLSEEQPVERTKYEKAIKDVFERIHLKIDENTSGKDLQIKKAYKEMYESLEIIKSVIEHKNPENKEAILQKIDNLQSSLKFINEINNHSTYIQIPMNMFDKNSTGELYVLRKGSNRKKIDPQNASVLVSLNTQNLGQIDSLVSVNKKNISLNLRVEDKTIIEFLKENYVQLYNSLKSKGYKLVDVKYRLIEEEINAINADRIIKKELDMDRQTIDFKI